jgi:hypothetical protein
VDWWQFAHVVQQQFSDLDQEMDGSKENATIQAPEVVYLYPACHGPLQSGRFLCPAKVPPRTFRPVMEGVMECVA